MKTWLTNILILLLVLACWFSFKQDKPQEILDESLEMFTKEKSNNRSKFISIIIPNNAVRSNGITIIFGNRASEKGNPVNVDADFVYFSFNYPNSSSKSVAVPLFSFQAQYAEL